MTGKLQHTVLGWTFGSDLFITYSVVQTWTPACTSQMGLLKLEVRFLSGSQNEAYSVLGSIWGPLLIWNLPNKEGHPFDVGENQSCALLEIAEPQGTAPVMEHSGYQH